VLFNRYALVPSGFRNFAEWLYEGMLKLVEQITGSPSTANQVFPLIGAIFVFFGISNLIGLIPGLTEWHIHGKPILRLPTSGINTTFSVAFAMVALIQVESIRQVGAFAHISKYIQLPQIWKGFHQSMGAGFNAMIGFFVGLLDIVGEFAKVISLSLRLFGNMYAGIVLTAVIMSAVAYALPSLWMAMGILTGIVQAIVFGSLVAAYYSISVQSE
jgi:F-type H+-transporting ATPase subunit a